MNIRAIGPEDIWLLVKYRVAYLAELKMSAGTKSEYVMSENVVSESVVNESVVNENVVNESIVSESIVNESIVSESQVFDNQQKIEQELYIYFKEALEQKRVFAFMAELEAEGETEAQVVGFGAMVVKTIPGDFNQSVYLEGDILNMYTVPHQRRKGVSALILERLIEEARERGISKIALHTTKAGEKLYRKQGFKEPVYPVLELPL